MPALTVGDALRYIAPGWTWQDLCRWPPDAFAASSVLLADSGAYRSVVCPPKGKSWPPSDLGPEGEPWAPAVRRVGAEWAAWAVAVARSAEGALPEPPEAVAWFVAHLEAASGEPLSELSEDVRWPTAAALLTVHAMADEACAGVGLDTETELQRLAAERLGQVGSLSRLGTDRVRVLPKMRPPESGLTLRSLSHHLAVDRSEVRASFLRAREPAAGEGPTLSRLTLLLVPHPSTIHAGDFRPVRGPLVNMDESRFGFYEYAPTETLDPFSIVSLVASARRQVGAIDAVVLPEAALEEGAAHTLQGLLIEAGVPYLIAGVRGSATEDSPFGANLAYFGGDGWRTAQHKHHRWCLDPAQVHQYHLGAALDPSHRWWEAIAIHRRDLTFVTIPGAAPLTICPLVCEDLARPDPVTDVLRAVAPTLVVALLLDGPQLASRWPARYASVLADDPGSSVLTLTAAGMAMRSQPPGLPPSRAVALWKDPHRGLQQIELDQGARGVALTAHVRQVRVVSADGRTSARSIAELVLSGLEQIV